MARALFIIDVQNDFTEGGALGVVGGNAVAAGVTELLRQHPDRYDFVFASRDWHDADNDNGGHFATDEAPNFVTTWPVHCVAGAEGAAYNSALDTSLIDVNVRKGQGRPAYSIFEGIAEDGDTLESALARREITDIDVVGIATDYCVLASALDGHDSGRDVRVLTDLIAGVAPGSSQEALDELERAGVKLVNSAKN